MYSSDRLSFRKSSYSNPQNCVEVADVPGGEAAIRDSKHPENGHFTIPSVEWAAFLDAAREGRF
ncbi:DUF397 domain-containing protein [Nocardiopsis baichengensis]|uniref:DUF397 domain-containing protein n=1 Tax=Nocardiopsis baichengensis TaxID=280240 RepID=UPI000349C841|nr:DUF397 domain-containing protein [Nocardiopsis baichengensis]